ncbi:MAG TPA: hydrogenase, partial [Thermoanaerobaculia bacterium]|nr:hydrogenase [Thermoanaerobaculia bacterium]
IRAAALQGLFVSVFPLLFSPEPTLRLVGLVIVAGIVKAFVIPGMLMRALREVRIRHEMEPYLGLVPSVLLLAAGTGAAALFAGRLPLTPSHRDLLVVPVSLSTLFAGFLLLTTRRKAISQVTGYLILENGIFVFAQLLHEAMPALVEVGVLLDLLVGIFVMGIVMNHIQREFGSLDTERLSELRD